MRNSYISHQSRQDTTELDSTHCGGENDQPSVYKQNLWHQSIVCTFTARSGNSKRSVKCKSRSRVGGVGCTPPPPHVESFPTCHRQLKFNATKKNLKGGETFFLKFILECILQQWHLCNFLWFQQPVKQCSQKKI